jgi:N-methylhydantoinase B
MDPSIPKNEGFFDEIELVVPEGCVLNPRPGWTVAAGTHHPGVEVGEAIAKALAKVLPERCAPQIYKLGMPSILIGNQPDSGEMFLDHGVDVFSAYCSAVKGQDGWGAFPASLGNLIKATAEVNESVFPVRHECNDFITDSGGAGQYRGGPGSRVLKRSLVPAAFTTWMVGMRYPMAGVEGGRDGSPNRLRVRVGTAREKLIECMANAEPLGAGEAFEYCYGGGGGWGDPLDRDPQRVYEDALDELVSVEAAWRDYGVVLRGSLEDWTLELDEPATRALRASLRR